MKRLLPLLMLLSACTPLPEPRVGLPWSLMDEDRGDTSGVWRMTSRNGRSVNGAYLLTIDHAIGTFAVQKGCGATGGTLTHTDTNQFRLRHYETGFAADGCPPWRRSAELAPFDVATVHLLRSGKRLTASSASARAEFIRVTRG